VDRLVNMGLLMRTEDPLDRRAKQLELTPKGRDLIIKGIDARMHWIESLTDSLSGQDLDMITSALTILTDTARKT